MKRILPFNLAVVCFCTVSSAFAEPEFKGTPAELAAILTNVPRTVKVTGEAEVKVQADRATLTVKVTATAKELGQALRNMQQSRAKLISTLTAAGLPPDALQASKFSFTQKTGAFSDKVKSHTVSHLLKVSVKNEKEFQMVVDAIDVMPEAQYVGTEFQRSDKEDIQARAIANACDKASERKKVFEEKLGLRLTPVRFNDPGTPYSERQTIVAGLQTANYRGQSYAVDSAYVSTNTTLEQSEDQSGFGELTFKASVTVEYSAERK